MASGEDQFLIGTAENTHAARSGAKKHTQAGGRASNPRRGKVTADNGDGSYTVGAPGADGTTIVQSFSGARPWDPNDTFAVNDRVWLVWEESVPFPWIFSGSGGSGATGTDTLIVGYIRFFS